MAASIPPLQPRLETFTFAGYVRAIDRETPIDYEEPVLSGWISGSGDLRVDFETRRPEMIEHIIQAYREGGLRSFRFEADEVATTQSTPRVASAYIAETQGGIYHDMAAADNADRIVADLDLEIMRIAEEFARGTGVSVSEAIDAIRKLRQAGSPTERARRRDRMASRLSTAERLEFYQDFAPLMNDDDDVTEPPSFEPPQRKIDLED